MIYAHSTGLYIKLYDLIGEGKGWLTVLYNVGLVTITAALLGLLMGRITGLLAPDSHSSEVKTVDNEKASPQK